MITNFSILSEALRCREGFFFVGSGISYDSWLASASQVLTQSSSLFLPTDPRYHRVVNCIVHQRVGPYGDINPAITRDILPELFYEQVLAVSGSLNALHIWRCLDRETIVNYGPEPSPNINHMFIVDYSARAGVPIFTTNFDDLLECAAYRMNYEPVVVLPHTVEQRKYIQRYIYGEVKSNAVLIFKLHGSIRVGERLSLESLNTTISSITAVNHEVIQFIAMLLQNKRVIFAGYSGQDIDLFPQLVRLNSSASPLWIDRFESDPMSGAVAKATERNRKAINAVPVIGYPDRAFRALAPSLDIKPDTLSDTARDLMFADLRKHVAEACPLSEEEKVLIAAQCLESSGYTGLAARTLKLGSLSLPVGLKGEAMILYYLASARTFDGLGQYRESEAAARTALSLLRRPGTTNQGRGSSVARQLGMKLIARHQMIMARALGAGPRIHYGNPEMRFRPSYFNLIRILLSYAKEVVATRHIIAMALHALDLSLQEIRYPVKANELRRPENTPVLIATHRWLDTRIIFFSHIHHLLAEIHLIHLPGIRRILLLYLQRLDDRSQTLGDYYARANVHKYLHRLRARDRDSTLTSYQPFGAFGGRALVYRDAAVAAYDNGDIPNAKRWFLEAYKLSTLAGHRPTRHKALMGLCACGVPAAHSLRRFELLTRGITGHGYEKYLHKLRMVFSSAYVNSDRTT